MFSRSENCCCIDCFIFKCWKHFKAKEIMCSPQKPFRIFPDTTSRVKELHCLVCVGNASWSVCTCTLAFRQKGVKQLNIVGDDDRHNGRALSLERLVQASTTQAETLPGFDPPVPNGDSRLWIQREDCVGGQHSEVKASKYFIQAMWPIDVFFIESQKDSECFYSVNL